MPGGGIGVADAFEDVSGHLPTQVRVGEAELGLFALAAAAPLMIDPGFLNTRQAGDSPFLLFRLHQLVAALADDLAEIDVNPVIASPSGALAVDALVISRKG